MKGVLTLVLMLSLTPKLAFASELAGMTAMCDACHGTNGISEWSDMPTIAGISAFVHTDALLAYRDRVRPCAQSKYRQGNTDQTPTDMCAIAANLSDAQIDALGAHYAALPFVAASQDSDTALVDRGRDLHQQRCQLCHSDNGANPDDDASILKGQWMGYMRQTFAEYAAGTREQPGSMKKLLDPLTKPDIEALLHFYASPDASSDASSEPNSKPGAP